MINLKIRKQTICQHAEYNYSYYPIIFQDEVNLVKSIEVLNTNMIYPRRYFYPSLNELPYVKKVELPISSEVSQKILCLPLYHTLSKEEIDFVARILLRVQNN